ncbi:MAG: hypothetical protein HQM08_21660 [Candidatus Riflebacteria bacterium]|nr:hypothetical protein [Candidatus Riflebacteria bacterium]
MNKKEIKLLFHVHSNASFDSILSMDRIIAFCQTNQINYLAVTDHDKFNLSQRKDNSIYPILIPGVEYSTTAGDIIGLFVTEIFDTKEPNKILDGIGAAGGLTVLPHPFKGHDLNKIDFEKINIIEEFNARCTHSENFKALELGKKLNKPSLVGSDAHWFWELPTTLNTFENQQITPTSPEQIKKLLLNGKRKFFANSGRNFSKILSQAVKGFKNYSLQYFAQNFLSTVKHFVLENWRR